MGTKSLNLSRGFEVQPTAGGGFVVYQYTRTGSQDLRAAYTDAEDLLKALAAELEVDLPLYAPLFSVEV